MPRLEFSFRGFIVPVLTPFKDDSARTIDISVIPKYAAYLEKKGVKGILVNGTSGEGMSMCVAERKTVAVAWSNAVKTTKQHLMIQVGGAPLPDVLELAKHAESIKADSLLCLPELYFKPSNSEDLTEYLNMVGKAAPSTPLLYYHFPEMTNVNIHMGQCLGSLGDRIPSFVGIKFTSTNLEEVSQALNVDNGKYAIFLGSDQIMVAGMALGLNSFIPTSVNMFPELALEMLEAGKKGDFTTARKCQEKLSKAVIIISKYGTWVQTMKAAMNILTDINVGIPRAPLKALCEEQIASMKNELSHLNYKI
ncbi:N-acetylneuraminate lyase isoform X2 [Orussus abietinus]|nr:N-acetylneuraminate lyase isoform X2 [Orussus abietinus]XP_012276817.1 N-acetylneuraminate lyase isoform X2 [Orussus abietinus]XP_012276818.1 N-acetylneuraminate lyase isoform X2 [Orussus abietinus]XP_012276819.1 N-acetylneuraminate lyase isoform X2 [Orussus abietinus]